MSTATTPESLKLTRQLRRKLDDEAAALAEHHDPEIVKAALAALTKSGDVAQAVERERAQRTARRTLDREEAEAELRLPPEREDYTLKGYLAEPRETRPERIEAMQREGHRTLLVAGYKTGKTTLHANLTKSLTEGTQFLGRFGTQRPQGRVGVWNAEMDRTDYEDYLTAAKVTKGDQVAIWNLRGYRLPLMSDVVAERAVKWLTDNEVTYWVIDPWARVCGWSSTDENANSEVGPLLQRVDEIANDAGVAEILVVHHAGHVKGRPRGATVLPDWADSIWTYWRDEDSDDRYIRAEGRGVAVATGQVLLQDGRTVYREADPQQGKVHHAMADAVAFVKAHDGCSVSEVKAQLTGGNALRDVAVQRAQNVGMLRAEADPADKRRKLLFWVSDTPVSDGLDY